MNDTRSPQSDDDFTVGFSAAFARRAMQVVAAAVLFLGLLLAFSSVTAGIIFIAVGFGCAFLLWRFLQSREHMFHFTRDGVTVLPNGPSHRWATLVKLEEATRTTSTGKHIVVNKFLVHSFDPDGKTTVDVNFGFTHADRILPLLRKVAPEVVESYHQNREDAK